MKRKGSKRTESYPLPIGIKGMENEIHSNAFFDLFALIDYYF
jgi:hypothetical protein